MVRKVFLDYTQEDLDRSFDQRAWVPNVDEILAERDRLNAAARAGTSYLADLRYGEGAEETLDVFPARAANAPILVFIHGGAWRNFTKADVSLLGPAFASLGVNCAILNFAKLPKVRLPQVVDQVRRAVAWVYANAASFGGDAARLYVMGNSSGAHLAAMVAITRWDRPLPEDLVKGAICGSGIYDLAPVVLSARSAYVRLEPDEVLALSPLHHLDRLRCGVFVAYAEHDTPEFRRQSLEFARALSARGRLAKMHCIAGANHFDAIGKVAAPDGSLARMMLSAIGVAAAAAQPQRGQAA